MELDVDVENPNDKQMLVEALRMLARQYGHTASNMKYKASREGEVLLKNVVLSIQQHYLGLQARASKLAAYFDSLEVDSLASIEEAVQGLIEAERELSA